MRCAPIGLSALALLGAVACEPPAPGADEPAKFLGDLATADEVVFAEEARPSCAIERSTDEAMPHGDGGWTKLASADVAKLGRVRVVQRAAVADERSSKERFFRAVRVRDSSGELAWLRNTPVASIDAIASQWRCALPGADVAAREHELRGKSYVLSLDHRGCTGPLPIVGAASDVTFGPYQVKEEHPFVDFDGKTSLAVTLASADGSKTLRLASGDLARCFAATTGAPPSGADVLAAWLAHPEGSPPEVPGAVLAPVAGLDPARCFHEGSDATSHLHCAATVARVSSIPAPGGGASLFVTRDRVVDALDVYGDAVLPREEIVGSNVVVRFAAGTPTSLVKSVEAAIVAPGERRQARAANDYRLLLAGDAGGGAVATLYLDVVLTWAAPTVEGVSERRTHRYTIGKKLAPNPDYVRLVDQFVHAKQALTQVAQDATGFATDAVDQASGLCDSVGSALDVVCGVVRKGARGVAGVKERVARADLDSTRLALKAAPLTVSVDDVRTYEFDARVQRRRGEALAKATLLDPSTGAQLITTTLHVPFEASDAEVPADADHKLAGHHATAPTDADVERALAESLVSRLDEMVQRGRVARRADVTLEEARPGTRAWLVSAAREAASERPVRRIVDMLETKSDVLLSPEIRYPIAVPEERADRCTTFAATPLDGRGDVNLALYAEGALAPLAKDERFAPDAGFELCGLPPGHYVLAVTFGGIVSMKGVLTGVFDSTPDGVSPEDAKAAAQGDAAPR